MPKTAASSTQAAHPPAEARETPFEALASICCTFVVGLFILTFLARNFVIPSGSMENTLLVGDHLLVDRVTLAPPSKWMPLVHYREPQRGDVVVFIKPSPEPTPEPDGSPRYDTLVKRLVGIPGDRIHLSHGTLMVNGVAQPLPKEGDDGPGNPSEAEYADEFPSIPASQDVLATATWGVEEPGAMENGELVVPPDMYFMMGDHRHFSLDSRYWGFVPRQNVIGRPLFNYWSFLSPDQDDDQIATTSQLKWAVHVVLHFFTDTRWSRTLHRIS
jgi:signal peptidase I